MTDEVLRAHGGVDVVPHQLSDIDRKFRLAACSVCGPGARVRKNGDNWSCRKAWNAAQARYRQEFASRSDEEIQAARLAAPDKVCPRCKVEKPATEFTVDRRQPNGRGGYCEPCMADYQAEWRAATR